MISPVQETRSTGQVLLVPFPPPQWDCLISVTNTIIKPGLHVKCLFLAFFVSSSLRAKALFLKWIHIKACFGWLSMDCTEDGDRSPGPSVPKDESLLSNIERRFDFDPEREQRTHGLRSDLRFLSQHPANHYSRHTRSQGGC